MGCWKEGRMFPVILSIITLIAMSITPALSGTLVDTFDDGNMDGWLGGGTCEEWMIKKGELILKSESCANGYSVGETSWQDYTVGVSVKIVEHQNNADFMETAAIAVRGMEFSSSYYFGIGTAGLSPKRAQAYYLDGTIGPLGLLQPQNYVSVPFEWELDTWYDLRVQVTGNQYEFYIDNNLVIEHTDDTFPAGKVGIGVGNNVSAHFDDFFITGDGIPDDSIAVSHKSKLTATWGGVR